MSIRRTAGVALPVLLALGPGCAAIVPAGAVPEPISASAGDALGAGPSVPRGSGLPDPAERPPAVPAARTHPEDPLAWRIAPRPVSGLDARNGALVGGIIGVGAGLAIQGDPWNRPIGALDRAVAVLFYGGFGAATGAAAGALSDDPHSLLWPTEAAGVVRVFPWSGRLGPVPAWVLPVPPSALDPPPALFK